MDTNKLKELAELASKATPGPWWIDSHGHCMVSESQDHRTVFLTNDGMGPATRHPETGNLSHWPNDWDASYIASADPTTILELIAEVERLRKDATIGAVVWQFIDRMTDICEQDPAERILEQFVAAARPAIDAALEGGGR